MHSSPRRRPPAARPVKPSLRRQSQQSNAGLMLLCGLWYAVVGFVVTVLPSAPWVWPLVLVGAWLHVLELALIAAQPQSSRLAQRLLQGSLRLLGAGSVTLALALALNHLGSDQLEDVTLASLFWQVLGLGLLAVLLTLLCRLLTRCLAERLQPRLQPRQVFLTLAATLLIGLSLGGTLGSFTL
ncbi:MAG: hypothetical protein HC929_00135 [Leptolyngbyaceae cyanobacterium SM2_5_2]|nr:hypothetical protein [Leptolyngbyaceae cyanobacterium SM2_5_2]